MVAPGRLVCLALCALVIVPAASATASAPTRTEVRAELRAAEQALEGVWRETGDGEDVTDVYDLDAVAANLAHTQAARDLAVRLARNRAVALTEVAMQADDNLYEYIDDSSWAPAELQPRFAEAVATTVALRDPLLRAILARAEKLTPTARAAVLRTVADALSDGDPDLLLEVLAEEDGAVEPVKLALAGSLGRILVDTDATLGDLRRLAGRLPRAERDTVQRAIGEIRWSLEELPGWIDDLLVDIEDFALEPAAAKRSFCGLLAGLPLPPAPGCG